MKASTRRRLIVLHDALNNRWICLGLFALQLGSAVYVAMLWGWKSSIPLFLLSGFDGYKFTRRF